MSKNDMRFELDVYLSGCFEAVFSGCTPCLVFEQYIGALHVSLLFEIISIKEFTYLYHAGYALVSDSLPDSL